MQFSAHLLKWYNAKKRDLPWRRTKEPYAIWISEIILQQTRVDQGLPYYERFIQKFPTVYSLANASENEVLKVWQGLGYYSRARNLHHAAKSIVHDYHGIFPRNYDEIINLKGIGSYTAAAISSICFDEPKAVVDGNVFRVLSRFHGIDNPIDSGDGKEIFVALANEVMDKTSPGEYNQAIMEFGALQCKPSAPDCASCYLNAKCHARNT
ncbi:MAG: A/G-specific adenine glycosylase, partial [Flavobacteriales bacterium]|nr:A/G-specific adenine glycosylase [Flavobacteriales bacterium]